VQNVGIICDQDVDFGEVEYAPIGVEKRPTVTPSDQIDRSELRHLNDSQQTALLSILDEFQDVFSD